MSIRFPVILGTAMSVDGRTSVSWVAGIYPTPIAAMKALTPLNKGGADVAKAFPRSYGYRSNQETENTKAGTMLQITDPEAPAAIYASGAITYKMVMGNVVGELPT